MRGDTRGWTDRTLARRYDAGLVVRQFTSIEACADAFAVDERQVYRWLIEGLSVNHADLVAGQLGVHPVDVWPSWFEDALTDTEELDGDCRVDRHQLEGQLRLDELLEDA